MDTNSPAPATPPISAPDPSWQAALTAWLQAHKICPKAAHEENEQGTVALRFTDLSDGRVINAVVVQGSWIAVLDQATFTMLRNAHVPPLSLSLQQSLMAVTVSMRYTLTHGL